MDKSFRMFLIFLRDRAFFSLQKARFNPKQSLFSVPIPRENWANKHHRMLNNMSMEELDDVSSQGLACGRCGGTDKSASSNGHASKGKRWGKLGWFNWLSRCTCRAQMKILTTQGDEACFKGQNPSLKLLPDASSWLAMALDMVHPDGCILHPNGCSPVWGTRSLHKRNES